MKISPQLKIEIYRFAVTGIGANIVNYLAYMTCFYAGISLFYASLVGYFLGLLVSYHLGRRWVFKPQGKITAKAKTSFLLIYSIGGLGMSFIIEFCTKIIGTDFRISWLAGAVFAVTNNFLGSKFLIFKINKL